LAVVLPPASGISNAAIVTVSIGATASCTSTDAQGGVIALITSRSKLPAATGQLAFGVLAPSSFTAVVPLAKHSEVLTLAMKANAGAYASSVGYAQGYTTTLIATLIYCDAATGNCRTI
jgi:hypothetical protein